MTAYTVHILILFINNTINRRLTQKRSVCILAEEAVRRRDNPAGGDQAAGAEIQLSNVNGGHPWMRTRQGRSAAKDPPPGYR